MLCLRVRPLPATTDVRDETPAAAVNLDARLVVPIAIGELLLLLCFVGLAFAVGLVVLLLSCALLRRPPACCGEWTPAALVRAPVFER